MRYCSDFFRKCVRQCVETTWQGQHERVGPHMEKGYVSGGDGGMGHVRGMGHATCMGREAMHG